MGLIDKAKGMMSNNDNDDKMDDMKQKAEDMFEDKKNDMTDRREEQNDTL